MNDVLLNRCEDFIYNFESIKDGLDILEDNFITNGGVLEEEELDMYGNYDYFINQTYIIMALNGFSSNSFDRIERCNDIIENLNSMKDDLENGNVNSNIDYEFILDNIYVRFSLYGSFIGL